MSVTHEKSIRILNSLLRSALFAAMVFVAIVFVFSATSILEQFRVVPLDSNGGDAFFLIEVVIAFLVAATSGLLCLYRLYFGSWHPATEKPAGDAQK